MPVGTLISCGKGDVVLNYNKVLLDSIDRERKGVDFFCPESDKLVLETMLDKINEHCGTDVHFLAEIDSFNIPGSGAIMTQYLDQFRSESIRSYLIPQMVSDQVQDCAGIVLSSYLHFKSSDAYIAAPGEPAPAHIYTRYDNAFRKLKPKKLKEELFSLACDPRDAFYLPFTMRMLASWRLPALESIFISYMDSTNITHESVGLPARSENHYPPLSFIKRELRFTAIDGLKYYPSENTIKLIKSCMNDPDKDICSAATKTFRFFEKHALS